MTALGQCTTGPPARLFLRRFWLFRLVFAGFVVLCVGAGAVATPGFGLTYVNYVEVIDTDANNRVRLELPGPVEDEDDWAIRLGTRSPSTFVFQDFRIYPGGFTGWHSHPGVLLVTVAEGVVLWYDGKCVEHIRRFGEFFTEGAEPHYVRNATSTPARLIITFIVAKGRTRRTDLPAPACAGPLGLK